MRAMKYLGDLIVLALIVVSLKACVGGAYAAPPHYELALMIYNTAQGHTTKFRSYKYLIRIGAFPSLKACDGYGQYAIDNYHAVKHEDMTVDLLDYLCVRLAQ